MEEHPIKTEQKVVIPYDVVDICLREMEHKHDLLQYQVDGWCAWVLIRGAVQRTLSYDLPAPNSDRHWGQQVALALQDLGGLLRLRGTRYVVKTYISGLADQEEGHYKDIWFDDLLGTLDTYVKIDSVNNPLFWARRQEALRPSDLSATAFSLLSGALALVGGPRSIASIAHALSTCLQNTFHVEVFSSHWIALRLRRFYWLRKLFSWLLQRLHPTHLLVADVGEYALVAAAKAHGIQVIELQHGFLDQYHSGYSWTSYAVPYKSHMPVPDRLFLYGEYWQKALEPHGFWQEALCVVGNPRIDQYRRRRESGTLPDICTLLLTTQGLATEETINFIADFLRMAQGRCDLHLLIKLHPVYEWSTALYTAAFQDDTRVQIWLGNEAPSTLELLTQVHFHLSISSTCHYDALGVGVPTVILPLPTYEIVLPLYHAGHAALARDPQGLVDIILQQRRSDISEDVRSYYFARDPLKRMTQALAGHV